MDNMKPNPNTKWGRGCDQCPMEAVVNQYYQCQNPHCKNYEPPGGIPRGQKVTSSASEIYETMYLFGLYSDPQKRVGRFKNINDLIRQSFRKVSKSNLPAPTGRLYHAISLEGIFHAKPDKPGRIMIMGARRPVVLSFHDWDASRRRWDELMHTRVTLV